jgi:hypothetical protein
MARILELNDALLTLTNISMYASLAGKVAGAPVSANVTIEAKKSSPTNFTFDARTGSSLGFSALLDKLWPSRPAALSTFVGAAAFPPMSVSYRSAASSFTITSTSNAPMSLFDNSLTFTSPELTFSDKPQTTFTMRAMVDIPSIKVASVRALLEKVNDQLYLKVGNGLAYCLPASVTFPAPSCFGCAQVEGDVTIAKILVLRSAQFTLGADIMSGSINSTFADTPVLVDFTLRKGNDFRIKAEATKPINLAKALRTLYPDGISGAITIPDFVSLPAMTVSYRSMTGKFSISSDTSSSADSPGSDEHCKSPALGRALAACLRLFICCGARRFYFQICYEAGSMGLRPHP